MCITRPMAPSACPTCSIITTKVVSGVSAASKLIDSLDDIQGVLCVEDAYTKAMDFVLSHMSVPIVTARASPWECILGLQDGRYEAYLSNNIILEWVRARAEFPRGPPTPNRPSIR